ncbi:MAG: hypothetical protein PF505_12785 [Vallitaleaceae bacterium]|jgi:hypothetical protein|nr:hypothetical protein [Vallitaleaceae bacterium]
MVNGSNNYHSINNAYQQLSPLKQGNVNNDGVSNKPVPPTRQGNRTGVPEQTGFSQQPSSAKFVTGEEARINELLKTYDEKTLKRMGIIECATCASRTYVDGSNDPGVSFKTPTHVGASQSVQAVVGHEMEHVGREQNKASSEGGNVISQSVSIHMSNCPECGVSYAAGGVTRTTTSVPVQAPTGQLVDMKL